MSSALSRIEHPSAWLADELSSRDEWQLQFSESELDELLSAAQCRLDKGEGRGPVASDSLPVLAEKLHSIQESLEHGSGVVRLRGFPADVPLDVAESAFWLLTCHIGTPVSQSAKGERIFHVRDAGLLCAQVSALYSI